MSRSIVEAMYAAFRARDGAAFEALCAPDLEWIQNAGFPGGATLHGARAVIENVFGGNDALFEEFRFQVEEWLDAGDSIVVLGEYTGRGRETGRELHAAGAHVYDVKGGLIIRFRQFADTERVWEALRP